MALITMFTDASFSRKHNRGTWAAWAKMNGTVMRRSGILRDAIFAPEIAELSAIANGLVALRQQWGDTVGPKVIIQTDCKNAIDRICRKAKENEHTERLVVFILEYATQHKLLLDLRHVKAHKGTATPRNAVNTFCDEECKRQMGLLLEQLRQPQLHLAIDNTKVA